MGQVHFNSLPLRGRAEGKTYMYISLIRLMVTAHMPIMKGCAYAYIIRAPDYTTAINVGVTTSFR